MASVADNRVRRRVHDLDLDGVTDVRLRVLETNGSAYAEAVEVPAYAERTVGPALPRARHLRPQRAPHAARCR